ncbi:hypothetical protein ACIA8G_12580 [Lentzea sp. NPDC051213]|uniref:hypothetical protein n=1 Tax=Lentzea sp. NPDC051213 TaxID=3364126 RepID=UPI0037AD7EC5
MKRRVWAGVIAVTAVVAGVVVGGVAWRAPATADVTEILAVHPDGTVEWVDAEIRPAEVNNSDVHTLPGAEHRHESKLAGNAVIRTALGCSPPHRLELAGNGLGAIECGRDEFLAMESLPYAPRLVFNRDGEIIELLGRYHP